MMILKKEMHLSKDNGSYVDVERWVSEALDEFYNAGIDSIITIEIKHDIDAIAKHISGAVDYLHTTGNKTISIPAEDGEYEVSIVKKIVKPDTREDDIFDQ